jgi:hypothetical protein
VGKPSDGLEELRQEIEALDGQIAEAQGNKTALATKRRELQAKKATEFSDSVDMFKLNELAESGGNVTDRALKSRTFDRNTNLEASIAKLNGAFEAVCRRLNELTAKRKAIASEIAGLENKSKMDALLKAHKALLDTVSAAIAAHAEFIALLCDAPADVGSMAGRVEGTDDFFTTTVCRKPRPGETIIDYLQWATARGVKGNPLFGSARVKGSYNDFRKGHVFNGFSINGVN